jgi:hypothetical protein
MLPVGETGNSNRPTTTITLLLLDQPMSIQSLRLLQSSTEHPNIDTPDSSDISLSSDGDSSDRSDLNSRSPNVISKSIWRCLLEQDSNELSMLLHMYAKQGAIESLLKQRVDDCPGEFVPRLDVQSDEQVRKSPFA